MVPCGKGQRPFSWGSRWQGALRSRLSEVLFLTYGTRFTTHRYSVRFRPVPGGEQAAGGAHASTGGDRQLGSAREGALSRARAERGEYISRVAAPPRPASFRGDRVRQARACGPATLGPVRKSHG